MVIDLADLEAKYKEGNCVGAIIMTHYGIEVIMNMIFDFVTRVWNPNAMLNRLIRIRGAVGETKSIQKQLNKSRKFLVSNYKFLTIASILFDMGLCDYQLYKSLMKFNTYRNVVAHRLLSSSPSQSELDRYFRLGKQVWQGVNEVRKKQSQEIVKRFK